MNLDELIPFEQVLEEALRDPQFRANWERLAPARAVANRLIAYRAEHGLSQTGLGRLLGVSQPAVARLEAGEHLPSLPTLLKLAEALDLEIVIAVTPPGDDVSAEDRARRPASIRERVRTPGGASLTLAIS